MGQFGSRSSYSCFSCYIARSAVYIVFCIIASYSAKNALLNTKYQEAVSKHIVFVFKVNDLSKVWLDDEVLVVVLANLLNNAIEACEKCEEKKVIKFKFMIEDDLIILSVRNTYSHSLIYSNSELKTSKTVQPEEHGVGIKNVIRIVEKYGGEYVIQNNEREFYFSVIIPFKEQIK